MVRHPERVRTITFFCDILILRGQNNENTMREKIAKIQIAIWGLRSAWIKKLKKTDPNFFQLFDPSTTKASNCDPTAHNFFMDNIFMILSLKIKISWQKSYGHNKNLHYSEFCILYCQFKASFKPLLYNFPFTKIRHLTINPLKLQKFYQAAFPTKFFPIYY